MSDGSQGRVALVEDDRLARRALQRVLGTMGFAVAAFASAEEFLTHERARRFRCLLLDVQLGGMSGVELSTTLAAQGREIPIIFISAAEDAEELVRTTNGRASAVLSKPLDVEQLRAALEKVPPA